MKDETERRERRDGYRLEACARETDPTRGEEARLAGELEAIFSSVSTGLIIFDGAGNIIRMNDWARGLLGEAGALTAVPPVERMARLDLRRADGTPYVHEKTAFARVLRGQAIHEEEMLLARQPGPPIWLSVSLAPIREGQGAVMLFRDVTERKRSEEELREKHRLLQEAQRIGRVGSWAWEISTDRVVWSEEMYRIFGLEADAFDATYQGVLALIHPEDRPLLTRGVESVLQDLRPYEQEARFLHADGSMLWLSFRIAAYLDEHGQPVRLIGTAQDVTDRRHREGELRASEELVRKQIKEIEAIYDSAPVGLCVLDRDLRFVRINKLLAEYNGLPAEAHLGKTLAEILPAMAETLTGLAERIFTTGQPVLNLELTAVTRARPEHTRYWLQHWLPLKDESGGVAGINVVLQEITARKAAEEALRRSESIHRAIAEHLPDGAVFLMDLEMRFLAAGGPLLARIGWRKEDFEGHTLLEAYGEHLAQIEEPRWRRALAGETDTYEMEYRGRVLLAKYAPLRDEYGRIYAAIALALDITERRQVEEAIRENEAILRAVMDGSTDTIYIKDCESRLIMANPATIALVGKPAGQIIGRTDAEFYDDPEIGRAIMENDRRIIQSGRAEQVEERVCFRGEERIFLSNKTPWRDMHGRIIGILGISRDITALKRKEMELRESEERFRLMAEDLREADRHKSEFMAILSHELRNPLASIQNCLHILERTTPSGEQAERAKNVIDRQFKHLTHLVDDLLDITRITQNKIRLQKQELDLNELVRRAVEDHRALFEKSGVRLELDCAPAATGVHADADRLLQVFGNLLLNAVKFTRRGESVYVSVACNDAEKLATVRVLDTGEGIPAEVLPLLFQPFMQADKASDRGRGGLGLGLALSKGLIELHRGGIAAHSDGPGKGAEFTVRLPLSESAAEALPAAPVKIPRRRRRVCIIEDNVDLAESLQELLRLDGHEVEIAHSGSDGLELARRCGPEILFCDIGLPGMDGYEVARAFRADAALKDVYLVALTGYAQPEDLRRAAEAGFDRHLAKPPEPAALEKVMAEI